MLTRPINLLLNRKQTLEKILYDNVPICHTSRDTEQARQEVEQELDETTYALSVLTTKEWEMRKEMKGKVDA